MVSTFGVLVQTRKGEFKGGSTTTAGPRRGTSAASGQTQKKVIMKWCLTSCKFHNEGKKKQNQSPKIGEK